MHQLTFGLKRNWEDLAKIELDRQLDRHGTENTKVLVWQVQFPLKANFLQKLIYSSLQSNTKMTTLTTLCITGKLEYTTNTDKTHCYTLSHLQDDWNQKVSINDIEHYTFARGGHCSFTEKFQSCWSLQFVKLQTFNIAVPSGVSLWKNVLTVQSNKSNLPCLILFV